MKILERLKNIFFGIKDSSDNSLVVGDTPHTNSRQQITEEKTLEELYPNMTDGEIWMAILDKDDDELTSEELSFKLGMTLHNEHNYGRSLAIRGLLDNTYQILPDEHGNPFKELINFTLRYFKSYNSDKPSEAANLLQNLFHSCTLTFNGKFLHNRLKWQLTTILMSKKLLTNSSFFAKIFFVPPTPTKKYGMNK